MTKAQKLIKYFAISLAIFLIVSIISTMIGLVSNIFGFSLSNETKDYKVTEITNKIDELDIDINSSKLVFKYDVIFKIEANTNVKIKEKNNKLTIEEKNTLFNDTDEEIIVYLPNNYIFNEVSIEAGSSEININELYTNKLELDLGAGAIYINNLNVYKNASIESGAGKLEIENSIINNLDLDMGVGKVILNTILNGSNEINAGMGDLEINLQNSINNYKFKISKGIGEIFINNEKYNDGYINVSGNNLLAIDGGIGNIKINTKH